MCVCSVLLRLDVCPSILAAGNIAFSTCPSVCACVCPGSGVISLSGLPSTSCFNNCFSLTYLLTFFDYHCGGPGSEIGPLCVYVCVPRTAFEENDL